MASINFIPGTVITSDWLNSVNTHVFGAQSFGAVGDGVANDTAALQRAVDHVKTYGGTLELNGVYAVDYINIAGTVRPWKMRGQGMHHTGIVRRSNDGHSVLFGNAGTGVPFTLEDFYVDCKHSVYSSGNIGIAIGNTSGLRIRRVRITDHKNSSILIYSTDEAVHLSDNIVEDCHADGLGVANNGMLMVNCDHSGFVRCTQKGVTNAGGGPGFGIQFKNNCRWSFMTDCYAEDCFTAYAFGYEYIGTPGSGAEHCTLKGLRAYDCSSVFAGSHCMHNTVIGVTADMLSAGERPIRLSQDAYCNYVSGLTVKNLRSTREVVLFEDNANNNTIEIAMLDNINTTGKVVQFGGTSTRNIVKLSRQINPDVRASGSELADMAVYTSTSTENSFEYSGYPMFELKTIATDAITINNATAQFIRVDTEASAATDDLVTINGWQREGRVIYLKTASNTRDVTVKNTGNIRLSGGADRVLSSTIDSLVLRYNVSTAQWIETAFADNA